MNNLESLVDTIEKKRALVAQEKDLVNITLPEVVRQKLGHIKRAKEDLKQLFMDYRKEIQYRTAFILVVGNKSEKFSKLAEEEFGCFISDAEILYKDIGKQIPTPLYLNKSSSPALFDHFAIKFEDRALEIDIVGYRHLTFESKYKKMLKSEEDMVNLMKLAFNDKIGSEVVGYDAIDRISEKAVGESYVGKTVPIILYSPDDILMADLAKNLKKITGNVFLVSTGTKIDAKLKNASIAVVKSATKKSIETVLTKVKENLL